MLHRSTVLRVHVKKRAFNCRLFQQGSPGDVLKDPRVQCWIENYRNLLDAWRFWHKRAEFDIHRGKLDPSSKPLAQVTDGGTPSVAERDSAFTFIHESPVFDNNHFIRSWFSSYKSLKVNRNI